MNLGIIEPCVVSQDTVVAIKSLRIRHKISVKWLWVPQIIAFGWKNKKFVVEEAIAHENVLNSGRGTLVRFQKGYV